MSWSQVKTYDTGDFFGEIALLLGEPRKAMLMACQASDTTNREEFDRLVGLALLGCLGAHRTLKHGDFLKLGEVSRSSIGGVNVKMRRPVSTRKVK